MPFPHLRRALVAVLVLVALVALAACGSDDDQTSTTGGETGTAAAGPNPELKGTVALGAVLPLTGASASIGKDQRCGIEVAVNEINAGDGVLGKKLEVKVEDSQGDANASLSAARKLVSVDDVPVVIGEYSSGNTIPIGQYLQQQGVVHINPGSSSPEIADIGDLSFSTIGLDDVAGTFTADALSDAGYTRAAYLAPNNAYGSGLLKAFRPAFEGNGGEVVESVLYTEGRSDYRPELQRIKDSDFDVVVYTAYGEEAATINKQAFQLGMDPSQFFGVYLTMTTTDAEPEAVEGQQGMDVNYVGPAGDAYEQAYAEHCGGDFATTFSGYTYDAVMMVAEAIDQAGSTNPAKIRDALQQVGSNYDGATGEITFDRDQQRESQPYLLGTMEDGKLQEIEQLQGPSA